jgi:nitroimidazol reductase NimA-like FMN-containing flavoprotein (pyridoxamine 5'-phosphate oxidase superfamily)
VHPEGRPNVAPLIAVWLEETLYFCTVEHERKAKNIAGNPSVPL